MAKSRVCSLPAPTSGGATQDYTVAGIGTATCIIVVLSGATSATSPDDDAIISVGVASNPQSGTDQNSSHIQSEDGQGNHDNDRRSDDDVVGRILNTLGQVDGEVTVDSWITDGVRLSWDNFPTNAIKCTVHIFDDDIEFETGEVTLNASGTTVLDVGFQMTTTFWHQTGTAFTATKSSANAFLCFGCTTYDGSTIRNRGFSYGERSSAGSGDPRSVFWNNRFGCNLNLGSSGSILSEHHVSAVGSTDMTITASGGGATYGYLAIKTPAGQGCFVDDYLSPTSTGRFDLDGAGWEGQSCIVVQSRIKSADVNSHVTSNDAGAFSIGMGDAHPTDSRPNGAEEQGAAGWANDDGAGTVDLESYCTDRGVILCPQDDGGTGADVQAEDYEAETDGGSLNFDEVDTGNGRLLWAWQMQEEPESGQQFMMSPMSG